MSFFDITIFFKIEEKVAENPWKRQENMGAMLVKVEIFIMCTKNVKYGVCSHNTLKNHQKFHKFIY